MAQKVFESTNRVLRKVDFASKKVSVSQVVVINTYFLITNKNNFLWVAHNQVAGTELTTLPPG